ncbi:HK97 family phage prohead protease, partial [Streptococcus pneumoniae]|nr:HK97 family phage prohead protease [Streptococcus pneumoniae]
MEKLKIFVVKSVEEESADFHFEAYASTYGNTDRDGDVMAKGCFD